jgi:Flp pilus assembly protein TadD
MWGAALSRFAPLAHSLFRESARAGESGKHMPIDENAGLQTAQRLYAAGHYARAMDALQGLIRARHPEGLGLLGLCQLRLGDCPGALASLHAATLLAPDDALLKLRHGIGLQAIGDHRQAVMLFRTASAALPLDPAPPINLATSFLALGRPRAAVIAARRAVRRAPDFAAAHYMLGQALMAADQADDATISLQDAVRLAPGFVDAWVPRPIGPPTWPARNGQRGAP